MASFVVTVIGPDQVGLVSALADAVAGAGGNWERSELAEVAGSFAGIVLVTVPGDDADVLDRALAPLRDRLQVTVVPAVDQAVEGQESFVLDLVGNDRPGIVREITAVLVRHGVTIDRLDTTLEDAPMGGGVLFTATALLRGEPGVMDDLTRDLEHLAGELMVDLAVVAAQDEA